MKEKIEDLELFFVERDEEEVDPSFLYTSIVGTNAEYVHAQIRMAYNG